MITTRHLKRLIAPMLTIALSIAVSYIGVLRAQSATAAKIEALQTSTKQDRADNKEAVQQSETRIRADISDVKSDVRELRNGQAETLRLLTTITRDRK